MLAFNILNDTTLTKFVYYLNNGTRGKIKFKANV